MEGDLGQCNRWGEGTSFRDLSIVTADYSVRAVWGMNCFRTLQRWDRGFEYHSRYGCLCLFCVCIGSGLATGWSPIQGVLPTVYKNKKLKWNEAFEICRVLQREQQAWMWWTKQGSGLAHRYVIVRPSGPTQWINYIPHTFSKLSA
jgi:hypothetical protein